MLSPGYGLAPAAEAASAAAVAVVGAGAGSLGTPSLRRQRLVPSSAAVGTAALGADVVISGGLPLQQLLILTAMHGRWAALHAAYCRWQRVVFVRAAAESASKYGGAGRGVEERRLTRLKVEAEAERRRLHEEHEQLAKAQASWTRDYKLEQAHVASETTRWRKLALRAAVTLLTVRMGVSAQCGVALRRWRLSIVSLDCERLVYLTAMRARSERLERALLASDKAGSLMSCLVAMHRWRRVSTIKEAEHALHDERVRAAHIARMLEGARSQLAQRVKLPLQLEEELSSSRAALEAELLRAKEAVNASKVAHKQADAAKAQRDAMESALRRAEAQLRAMQRDRSRLEARPVTAEHATQAGLALDGSEGDDGSALELAARQSAQASLASECLRLPLIASDCLRLPLIASDCL